ncbi:unknown protein [Seminavis robusta]|uniref:Uncharacterized protein n=1 Tax=Seminavis robusta TaxID=568900 RepID=A0A9N8HU94_9STRA|nr:unknown protein [Seminavis robusta]|eukprot:Sro1714_g293040.1 n/a (130) ;mRNA; f:19414-19803
MNKLLEASLNGMEEAIVPKHTKKTSEEETTFVRLEKKKDNEESGEEEGEEEEEEDAPKQEAPMKPETPEDEPEPDWSYYRHQWGPQHRDWSYYPPSPPPGYGRPYGYPHYYNGGDQRPPYYERRHWHWN